MISANALNWLFTLATSISFAFIGILVPNLYKQTKTPRPHNRHKFLNEFLARHQLTYITFFIAVVLTADFKPGFEWVKKLFALALAMALSSYFIGVYFSVHQDDLLGHGCGENGQCARGVSFPDVLKLCRINLLTTVILLCICLALLLALK
jgi:hypothetical protein